MIKEITMYTVICDNCGEGFVDRLDIFKTWSNKQSAVYSAMASGWLKHDDKHYCDNCFSWGERDELILKDVKNEK